MTDETKPEAMTAAKLEEIRERAEAVSRLAEAPGPIGQASSYALAHQDVPALLSAPEEARGDIEGLSEDIRKCDAILDAALGEGRPGTMAAEVLHERLPRLVTALKEARRLALREAKEIASGWLMRRGVPPRSREPLIRGRWEGEMNSAKQIEAGIVALIDESPDALHEHGRDALAARVANLDRCLRFFTDAYPTPEWKYMLHEEGCTGARNLPEERDGEECECDGDEMAEEVLEALGEAPAIPDARDAKIAELSARVALLDEALAWSPASERPAGYFHPDPETDAAVKADATKGEAVDRAAGVVPGWHKGLPRNERAERLAARVAERAAGPGPEKRCPFTRDHRTPEDEIAECESCDQEPCGEAERIRNEPDDAPAADPLCARDLGGGKKCGHPKSRHVLLAIPGPNLPAQTICLADSATCPCPGFVPEPSPRLTDAQQRDAAALMATTEPAPPDGPGVDPDMDASAPSGVGDGGTAPRCIHYESADGEPDGACHCGHSVEEHPNGECETCGSNTEGGEGC